MGLLKADSPVVVLVLPGEHLIDADTSDGTTTVRTKVEVDRREKTVDLRLKSQSDQQSTMQHPETPSERAETGTALSPTWTDPATRLMWTRRDNGADVDWNQANAFCTNSKLAGYKDWRLPTIAELQGIYDPDIKRVKKFDNGVTYTVHAKGNLELTGWDWSSTLGEHPGRPYHLVLDRIQPADGFPIGFAFSMRALCVRTAEK